MIKIIIVLNCGLFQECKGVWEDLSQLCSHQINREIYGEKCKTHDQFVRSGKMHVIKFNTNSVFIKINACKE